MKSMRKGIVLNYILYKKTHEIFMSFKFVYI